MISHEKSFTTSKGEFKIKIKKTKQEKIVLSIHNKKYGYPLLKDEFDDEVKAVKEFNYHCKKIQKEEGTFEFPNKECQSSHAIGRYSRSGSYGRRRR